MPQQADTRYAGPGVYDYQRPWGSNEERLTTEALERAIDPGAVLQAVQAPLPQIQQFPPHYGYPDKLSRTPTINQVVNITDRFVRYDFSGSTSGYAGSERYSDPIGA